jgi:hypothetical protein
MKQVIFIFFIVSGFNSVAQNISAKSNEIRIDFSDPRKDNSVSIPTINWSIPRDTISYLSDGKYYMAADVKSIYGLNSVKIFLKNKKTNTLIREFKQSIEEGSKNIYKISRDFNLPAGEYEIEIQAENMEGFSAKVTKLVRVDPSLKK